MFYRKRKLTSCCVEKNSFDVSKWQPDPVRNPLFSSLKRNPSRPKNFLFSSSSKNPYACPPRKKFFSCVWIPLPKKKILCVLSAKKSSQRVFSAKYSSACCPAKIVFLPIYMAAHSWNIFFPFWRCAWICPHTKFLVRWLFFLKK